MRGTLFYISLTVSGILFYISLTVSGILFYISILTVSGILFYISILTVSGCERGELHTEMYSLALAGSSSCWR